MRLLWALVRAKFLDLARAPAYWVPTALFPVMLFLFFGVGRTGMTERSAALVCASWSVFAVLGVAFYQFGVGIAQDRESAWDRYTRILPSGPAPRFSAQIVVAVGFAAVAVGLVLLAAALLTPVTFTAAMLGRLCLALAAGAIPFALFGIAIGYLATGKSAVPIANLIHLPLAFAGGLWLPPRALPDAVERISLFLPTRHYGELAWAAAAGRPWPLASWSWLFGYTLVFAAIALWAYRRDENLRYG